MIGYLCFRYFNWFEAKFERRNSSMFSPNFGFWFIDFIELAIYWVLK